MLSLRKKQAALVVEPEVLVKENGKGRPTPTRKQAQARRGSPATRRAASRPGAKPADPKAAKQAMREARRAKTAEYRAAMNSGDVSRLPARERVPERIMARDLVDQRRNLGPLLLGIIIFAYCVGLVPVTALKIVAFYLLPLCLIGIVADSVIVARSVTRKVAEKYPNTTVRLKAYAGQRALFPARWRQPRPRAGIVVGRWLPKR
jgi:hypothetical protein